jgi:outer membrane biosynthesis protein TonB
MIIGAQASPTKPQPTPLLTAAANHSALLSVANKLEVMGAEGKLSLSTGPAQSVEPPTLSAPLGSTAITPAPSTQHQQPQQSQHQQPAPPLPPQQQPAPPQQQQQQSPLASQPQQTSPQQQQQSVQPQQPLQPTQQEQLKPASGVADTTKPRTEAPKPEFKVATPPRNSKRKRETKVSVKSVKQNYFVSSLKVLVLIFNQVGAIWIFSKETELSFSILSHILNL